MKEIEQNKKAWGLIAEDHYYTFLDLLKKQKHSLNNIIIDEIGDIANKSILHLQCNTGADSIAIAKLGAKKVTGVDLVPENIFYAKKISAELNIKNIEFIESNVLDLLNNLEGKYDIVFTSEGAIGWIPDLEKWAKIIKYFLAEQGFFYAFDSHPFQLLLDEDKFKNDEIIIKYPYFNNTPDEDEYIGGYASSSKKAKNYFWDYKISDIINSLINSGLKIKSFNEFDKLYYDMGDMKEVENGLFQYPYFSSKIPLSFSIKATH